MSAGVGPWIDLDLAAFTDRSDRPVWRAMLRSRRRRAGPRRALGPWLGLAAALAWLASREGLGLTKIAGF
jgi:hypothetical protein